MGSLSIKEENRSENIYFKTKKEEQNYIAIKGIGNPLDKKKTRKIIIKQYQ